MRVDALKARLREDLKAAMRAGEKAEVGLLRNLAAALDNAEAVPLAPREQSDALRMEGGGASEAMRRELTADDIDQVLGGESGERLAAAAEYEAHGRPGEAARLRAEATTVARYRRAC